MNMSRMRRSALGVLIFAFGWASGLTAQTLSDVSYRTGQKRADLSGAPDMEVISSIVEIRPGESSELHSRPGIEVFNVLQGSMVQVQGQAPSPIPTGLTAMNLRDVKHGAFKVVGESSLKLFTVHIVDKNKPLYNFSK